MDIAPIIEGLKTVGGMVTGVFDFLGKGKLDATEAMRRHYDLQLKVRELESYAWRLQTELTEKMMAAAPWRTPLALASGSALILVCLFNIVTRAFEWTVQVDVRSPETVFLIGFFAFVAVGDVSLLKRAMDFWQDWREKRKPQQKEPEK